MIHLLNGSTKSKRKLQFRGHPPQFVGYKGGPDRSRVTHYSKRDYEAFAHMLKSCKPMTTVDNKDPANLVWAQMVNAMASFFHEDNVRFDILTFVKRLHEHEQT